MLASVCRVTRAPGDGRILVANRALEPVGVPVRLQGLVGGSKGRLGVRPQYLTPVHGDGHDLAPGSGKLHGQVALTERLGL